MEKRIKKILTAKVFLWRIIPLLLFLFWLGLTVFYIIYIDTSFSAISYNEKLSSFTYLTYNKLLKGNSVRGYFTAEDKNLGIVAVRFQTFLRPAYQDEDKLLFQIKEKGSKDWYYENKYRIGFVYDLQFMPFGFPIIHDSKGKTYEFAITSLNGNANNSVAVSNRGQILTTKYKYTKKELLQDKKLLLIFSIQKFINAMETAGVFFSSVVYFLPLFFYIIIVLCRKYIQKISNTKLLKHMFPTVTKEDRFGIALLDGILLIVVFIDSLYLQLGNSMIFLLIPVLWIITQRIFGANNQPAFVSGIGMLFIPSIFLALGFSTTAEYVAVYAYLFLATGVIQSVMEIKIK